jgi:hypothetical protein
MGVLILAPLLHRWLSFPVRRERRGPLVGLNDSLRRNPWAKKPTRERMISIAGASCSPALHWQERPRSAAARRSTRQRRKRGLTPRPASRISYSSGRRHRLVQCQRLQYGDHGIPHAQHRPDRPRGCGLHRLVRPAEPHRRPRRFHHRTIADPHRPHQGRTSRRSAWPWAARSVRGRCFEDLRLRHRPVRQEPFRRPQRAPADRAWLRRVLWQSLSPQRRGRAAESRLSQDPGVPAEIRAARRSQDQTERRRRSHG